MKNCLKVVAGIGSIGLSYIVGRYMAYMRVIKMISSDEFRAQVCADLNDIIKDTEIPRPSEK